MDIVGDSRYQSSFEAVVMAKRRAPPKSAVILNCAKIERKCNCPIGLFVADNSIVVTCTESYRPWGVCCH